MFSYLRAIYGKRCGEKEKSARYTHAGRVKHRSEADIQNVSVEEFQRVLQPILKELHIKEDFLERSVNEEFSGGEKKKAEILQLAVLKPSVIILDETDSGLDIDALRTVAAGVKKFRAPDSIVLIITHYQRILRYIKPDFVHVMMEGRIIASGDYTLAQKIERGGYGTLI
jgi:Fe-S cluster assembly ATP-binding protein